jgi:rSAM/selenodomain-associated transferase 2
VETILKISIVIPVLHEAASINSLVARIGGLEHDEKPQIIVVDGDPEGTTIGAIESTDVVRAKSERGRGRQMNEGAKEAQGNVLLFLHADTELPAEALRQITSVMTRQDIVAGAFDLGVKSRRFIFRIIEGIASFRSRVSRIPFGDQAIFIRRDYFNEIGGYDEIPLMEDLEIMRRIKKRGDKIFIIHTMVMTSPRRWEQEGMLYCTLRNWFIQILYYCGVSPQRLAKYYKHG